MEKLDKGCPMIGIGVSGRVFLLVPAQLGSFGQRTIEQLRVCVCVCRLAKCKNVVIKTTYIFLNLHSLRQFVGLAVIMLVD